MSAPTTGGTVALVVLDEGARYPRLSPTSRVLLAVRDAATNPTHPNVVSVPTARVPAELLAALWRPSSCVSFGSTELAPWAPRDSRRLHSGHDPVLHVVSSILSRKVGLGDALELGEVAFEAGVVARTTGWSYYGSDRTPSSERLVMVTVLVALRSGASAMPERTASYSALRFVGVEEFVEAARRKDPSLVELEAVDLCLHGLCIASAHDVLAASLDRPPYPRSAFSLHGGASVMPPGRRAGPSRARPARS